MPSQNNDNIGGGIITSSYSFAFSISEGLSFSVISEAPSISVISEVASNDRLRSTLAEPDLHFHKYRILLA
jgi:hypothetical protein